VGPRIRNKSVNFYGATAALLQNPKVKRNIKRFPEDFMSQLTEEEKEEVVAKCDHFNQFSNSTKI
jgi:hypothetical protein